MTELDPDVALFVSLSAERLLDAVVHVTDARVAVSDSVALLEWIGVRTPYLSAAVLPNLSTHAHDLFDWAHDLGRLSGPRQSTDKE